MSMQQNIKPKYEVHKLEGSYQRRIATVNHKSGGFNYEEVETPRGYMVYFPNGSSVHIRTKEELARQGFDLPPKLIDMETGDEVGDAQPQSLKSVSESKNSRSQRGNTDLEDLIGNGE